MHHLLRIINGLTHCAALLALLCLLAGCTNAFTKHYRPLPGLLSEPSPCEEGEVQIFDLPAKDKQEIYRDLLALGYAPIGEANWLGPLNMSSSQALEQAENLDACLVMRRADYRPAMTRMQYQYYSVFFTRIKPDPLGAVLYAIHEGERDG